MHINEYSINYHPNSQNVNTYLIDFNINKTISKKYLKDLFLLDLKNIILIKTTVSYIFLMPAHYG